jgi:hypothetical protein
MYDQHDRTTGYSQEGPPDRSAAVIYPARRRPPWLTITACCAAAVAMTLAAVTLAMFLSYKSTVTTQIHQLHRALNTAQAQDVRNYSGLSGTISTVLARYGVICSQDLTGTSGPEQFWFPCTSQRPG